MTNRSRLKASDTQVGEGEGRMIESIGQETLLAIPWQERSHTYSNTREAVCTLKHPIRGNQRDAIRVDTCYTTSGVIE
jgi:hypothetical protein